MYFVMYSTMYSVLQNAPCTLLEMACTLMGQVEYIVLWLYSGCTFGAQRGVRKVQSEYTSCAEYNKKYVKYMLSTCRVHGEYIENESNKKRSQNNKKRSTSPPEGGER